MRQAQPTAHAGGEFVRIDRQVHAAANLSYDPTKEDESTRGLGVKRKEDELRRKATDPGHDPVCRERGGPRTDVPVFIEDEALLPDADACTVVAMSRHGQGPTRADRRGASADVVRCNPGGVEPP